MRFLLGLLLFGLDLGLIILAALVIGVQHLLGATSGNPGLLLLFPVVWGVMAWQESLFRTSARDVWDLYFAVLRALFKSLVLLGVMLFLTRAEIELDVIHVILGSLIVLLALPLVRVVIQVFLTRRSLSATTLLVGEKQSLSTLLPDELKQRPLRDFGLQGVVLLGKDCGDTTLAGLPVLGNEDRLLELLSQHQVQQVLIVSSGTHRDDLMRLLKRVLGKVQQLYLLPDLATMDIAEVESYHMGPHPVFSFNQSLRSPFNQVVKRSLDIAISSFGLLFALPLLAVIAVLVKLDSPGPVLYAGKRWGRGGRTFNQYKVRTMIVGAQEALEELLQENPAAQKEWEASHKLREDPRITQLGRFLRSSSLDELPQLFNVLRGDMSLVGPRPKVREEQKKVGVWLENAMIVRPGLTGLWQISGRNDVSYEERVKMDMYYIRNWTIWMDLRILLRTVVVLFKQRGAY